MADILNQSFSFSPTTAKLDEALAKAQAKITNAKHNAENPHFGKSYADLAAIWDACRGPLAEAGISVTQWPMVSGNQVSVLTRVAHLGEFMQVLTTFPAGRADAQGIVGTITYLKRAALGAIAGVAGDGEDDDGERAVNRDKNKQGGQADQQPKQQGPKPAQGKPNQQKQGNGPTPNKKPAEAPPEDPGEYVVPFGSCKGRKLADLNDAELKGLEEFYAKMTTEPRGTAAQLKPALERWLTFLREPAHKTVAAPAAPPAKPSWAETLKNNEWSEAEAKEWAALKFRLPEGQKLSAEQFAELERTVRTTRAKEALFMVRDPK